MDVVVSRLRLGEVVAGASGALLLVFMLALPWYGLKPALAPTASTLGVPTSLSGWHALSHLRWLMVVTILAALALAYFQAACRAPAIPATLSVIATILGLLTTVALIYRVLISVPGQGGTEVRAGAYLALLSALGILFGSFVSMRQEGIRDADGPGEIETVRLGSDTGS